MDRNGKESKCTICLQKCHWSHHQNLPYVIEWYDDEVSETVEEMLQRYNIAESEKNRVRLLLEQLVAEFLEKEMGITEIVRGIRQRLNRLDEIAMRKGHMTDAEYIKALIQSERTQMRAGYDTRIATLERHLKTMELIAKASDGSNLLEDAIEQHTFEYLFKEFPGFADEFNLSTYHIHMKEKAKISLSDVPQKLWKFVKQFAPGQSQSGSNGTGTEWKYVRPRITSGARASLNVAVGSGTASADDSEAEASGGEDVDESYAQIDGNSCSNMLAADDTNDDVNGCNQLYYFPPSQDWLSQIAISLNVDVDVQSIGQWPVPFAFAFKQSEQPHEEYVKSVEKDGNCFFRSLAYLLLGSESHHSLLRIAIVNHMAIDERGHFADYLHMEASDYLDRSKMYDDNVYATDYEILAAASLFKCNIFVFDRVSNHENNRWKCYNAVMETGDPTPNVPCLLLDYAANHFNPVLRM